MNSSKVLLMLLVIIGIAMIVIGVKANIPAPALTGVGFFIIAYLYNKK
ncbi:MAG: hypothetical protein IMY67_03040 [Bacteroidetes bacterium]|nr:hypothetical protein [Bacteroidota bacterium]